MDLRFEVVGLPLAQGRARARVVISKTGKPYPAFYDPPASADWKRTVQAQALAHRPRALNQGPLYLSLVFRLPRPKSLPKRLTQHTRKPDVDNLTKSVLDALRKVIYRDDAQIVSLVANKVYGHTPGVSIHIAEWGP